MMNQIIAENQALRRQLDMANQQIASLTAEVGRLATMMALSNERMLEVLAVAQRRTARPASAAKAPPPATTATPVEAAAYAARPSAPPIPEKPVKVKAPQRPTGRKPLPDSLVAEEHTLRPLVCGECKSSALTDIGKVTETKLHVVAAHQRKRVVDRITCRCKDCDATTTAVSLPAPFARSKASCEWLAWLIHSKFSMLVPIDRTRRDLKAKGLELSHSYLISQIERAADLLAKIDGEQWKTLLRSKWMAMDATSLKVLVPGISKCHNGYLEAYHNGREVVFQYEPSKAAETLLSKLAPFEGTIVADAEHRHNGLFAAGRNIEAGCNAHGRRKLRDAEATQPALAKEAGAFVTQMYLAEAEAKKQGLVGEPLKAWRQEKIRPLQDDLKTWMAAVKPQLMPDDELFKVINYYQNHWNALVHFVNAPEIPIDNSATERLYQNVAKIRLNSLFAGSTEGAHRMAVLLGLAATCQLQKVDFEAYLAWAFTRVGTHADRYNLEASQLTPAAYVAERSNRT
jgi:transposase